MALLRGAHFVPVHRIPSTAAGLENNLNISIYIICEKKNYVDPSRRMTLKRCRLVYKHMGWAGTSKNLLHSSTEVDIYMPLSP